MTWTKPSPTSRLSLWLVGATLGTCLVSTATPAAAQNCRPGSTKVGEKRVPIPGGVRIHPICRLNKVVAPVERGVPFSVTLVEDTVAFTATAPEGARLTVSAMKTAPLTAGTKLRTGPGGRATIGLADGTIIRLNENTYLVVDRTRRPAPEFPTLDINFVSGLMRWTRHKIEKAVRPYQIRAGRISVSVRGTDFELSYNANGSGWLKLHEGLIDYRTVDDGPVHQLRAGQTLRFFKGGVSGIE